jgi:subtilisin-like proprotein convertase family protein
MKLRSAVATVSVLAAGCLALCGQGFQTNDFTAVNLPIPDGNPAGAQDVHQISSVIRRLNEVRVRLKISAATNSFAFNGDLYVYLRHSAGASAHLGILLNRAGKAAATPLGYADDGFDVVFADTAAHDIHTYRLITMPSAGTPLTGTWQPDARFVDPLLVDTNSPRTVFLGNLAGMEAQGEWTLFVADMDPGGVHVLESWSLELSGAVAHLVQSRADRVWHAAGRGAVERDDAGSGCVPLRTARRHTTRGRSAATTHRDF